MSKIDLNPIHNNPDLPAYFKQHILKRIDEQNGQYGLAWRLIRRFREGRYCLAQKSGGRLCLYSAKVPGDGPRGRCGWHGGTGNSGPKTAEGKKRIGDAQRLRWARYRITKENNKGMTRSERGMQVPLINTSTLAKPLIKLPTQSAHYILLGTFHVL